MQPAGSSSEAAAHSMGADSRQRLPSSPAGQSEPGHQACVQGQRLAVPCDVIAPAAAAASATVPTDGTGQRPAPSQQQRTDPPASSAVHVVAKHLPAAAVSQTGSDAVKTRGDDRPAAPASETGSDAVKAGSTDRPAEAASLWTSPVKPVKAAPEQHSKPGRAPADVLPYPAQLAPVTPEKHDAPASQDADLPMPVVAAGRRRAASRSQPVGTRCTSAHGTAPTGQNGPAAAEQEPQVSKQAGRRQHALLESARESAAADTTPPARRPPQAMDCEVSAAGAAQLLPGSAEPVSAGRQEHGGRQAPSEPVQQSGAKPVRVVANRELAKLLAAQPALELSSLLTGGVSTRRQCAEGPSNAAALDSSRRDAAAKAADRTEPRTPSLGSKRQRDLRSVPLRAAPAQPSKKQRTSSNPAAGFVAGSSAMPASIDAGAMRLRRKQAEASSVRLRHRARPTRGVYTEAPTEHRALTRSKPSAVLPDTATAARNRTAAADIEAGPAGSRRTRSQAKACDVDAASPAPCLQTTGLPSEPRTASNGIGIRSSSRCTAAASTETSSIAGTPTTPSKVQPQHRGTRANSRGPAARRAVASGQVSAPHPPATCCEAVAAPLKRVAIKRELALLLRGSGSAGGSSGGRADELPAGLALRNRCVISRTTVTARSAASQAEQQVHGITATVRAAKTALLVGSPQEDDSTAAAEHIAPEHHLGKRLRDNVAADAARTGVAAADVGTTAPAMLDAVMASQQPENPSARIPKWPEAPTLQQTGIHGHEPNQPAARVSSDRLLLAGLGTPSASQPTSMPTEPRQASSIQATQLPVPLLPTPPMWGGRGRRSMDVAAAEATARGRTLRAVRPDYARLAATEAAATRLPVCPGPQVQVLTQL